jgi:hypothetical protein
VKTPGTFLVFSPCHPITLSPCHPPKDSHERSEQTIQD